MSEVIDGCATVTEIGGRKHCHPAVKQSRSAGICATAAWLLLIAMAFCLILTAAWDSRGATNKSSTRSWLTAAALNQCSEVKLQLNSQVRSRSVSTAEQLEARAAAGEKDQHCRARGAVV